MAPPPWADIQPYAGIRMTKTADTGVLSHTLDMSHSSTRYRNDSKKLGQRGMALLRLCPTSACTGRAPNSTKLRLTPCPFQTQPLRHDTVISLVPMGIPRYSASSSRA